MKALNFQGIDCALVASVYQANDQLRLDLVSLDTESNAKQGISPDSPVATATVCVPEYRFADDTTAIKDYSENEGLLKALILHQVVEVVDSVSQGFVDIPVVRLLGHNLAHEAHTAHLG